MSCISDRGSRTMRRYEMNTIVTDLHVVLECAFFKINLALYSHFQ